jgi:hypothetical protein
MGNEFQQRAEVVRKYVEQRRELVLRARELMHEVVAEHSANHGDFIVGTLKRYEACENCKALMDVLDDLLAPEVDGHA